MSNADYLARQYFPASTPPAAVSGLAIASLTLGLLTVLPAGVATVIGSGGGFLATLLYLAIAGVPGLLAIVFGHVALGSVRTGERRGRGMAVWGLCLGYYALFGPLVVRFTLGLLGLA